MNITKEEISKVAKQIQAREPDKVTETVKQLLDTFSVPSGFYDKAGKLKLISLARGVDFLIKNSFDKSYINNIFFTGSKLNMDSKIALAMLHKKGVKFHIDEFHFSNEGLRINEENKNLHHPPFGACCVIKRAEGQKLQKIFTLDDAKRANLINKSTWKFYTSDLLYHKARIRAINSAFPEIFNEFAFFNEMDEEKPEEEMENEFKVTNVAPSSLIGAEGEDKPGAAPVFKNKVAEKLKEFTDPNENEPPAGPLKETSPPAKKHWTETKKTPEQISEILKFKAVFGYAKQIGAVPPEIDITEEDLLKNWPVQFRKYTKKLEQRIEEKKKQTS